MRSWNNRRAHRQTSRLNRTSFSSKRKGEPVTFLDIQKSKVEKIKNKSKKKVKLKAPYSTLDILKNDKFEGATSVFILYVPIYCASNKVQVTSKALLEYLYYGIIEEDKLVSNFLLEMSELTDMKKRLDSDLLNIPNIVLRDTEGNVLSYEIQEAEKEKLLEKLVKELGMVEMAIEYQEKLLKHHIEIIKSSILTLEPGPIDYLTETRNWKIIFNKDSKYKLNGDEENMKLNSDINNELNEMTSGINNFQFLENLLVNKRSWAGINLSLGGDLPNGEFLERPWAGRLELNNFGIDREEIETGGLKNNNTAKKYLDMVLKRDFNKKIENEQSLDDEVDKPIIISQKPYSVNLVGTRIVRLPDGVGLNVQLKKSISTHDERFEDTLTLNSEKLLYKLEDNNNQTEIYYGEYEQGRREGYGVSITNDSIYYGNYQNNLKRGTGRLELGDGTTVIGQFGITYFNSISDPNIKRLYFNLESVEPEKKKKSKNKQNDDDNNEPNEYIDPSHKDYVDGRSDITFPYSFYEEYFANPYIEGDFNGPVEIFYSDGGYFKGTMVNGVIEGPGDYQSGIGEILSGPFTKNRLHCKDYPSRMKSSTFSNISSSLSSTSTNFASNPTSSSASNIGSLSSVSSSGFYQSPTGEQYLGSFFHGVPHGWGYYRTSKGDSYEGTWNFGQRHGLGVSKYSQPDKKIFGKYNGFFRYDYKFGRGSLYSGKIEEINKEDTEINTSNQPKQNINNINKIDNILKFNKFNIDEENMYDENEKKKLLKNLKEILQQKKNLHEESNKLFPTTTETITTYLVNKEKKLRKAQENKFHTLNFNNYFEDIPIYDTNAPNKTSHLPELQVNYDSVFHGYLLGNKLMTSGCIMPINFKKSTSNIIEDDTKHGEYREKTEEDYNQEREEENLKKNKKFKIQNNNDENNNEIETDEKDKVENNNRNKYIKPFYPSILSNKFLSNKKSFNNLLKLEIQNLINYETEMNNLLTIQTYLRIEMTKKKLKFFHQQLHYTKHFIKNNFSKESNINKNIKDSVGQKLKNNLKVQETLRNSRLNRLKKINAISHFHIARIPRLRQDMDEMTSNVEEKPTNEDDFDFFSTVTSSVQGLPSIYDKFKNLDDAQSRIKSSEILIEQEKRDKLKKDVSLPLELINYETYLNSDYKEDKPVDSNFVSNVFSYMEETKERQRFLKYDAIWQRAQDSYQDYKKKIQRL